MLDSLAFFISVLQLLVLQPAVSKPDEEAPTLLELMSDPYIVISAGGYSHNTHTHTLILSRPTPFSVSL